MHFNWLNCMVCELCINEVFLKEIKILISAHQEYMQGRSPVGVWNLGDRAGPKGSIEAQPEEWLKLWEWIEDPGTALGVNSEAVWMQTLTTQLYFVRSGRRQVKNGLRGNEGTDNGMEKWEGRRGEAQRRPLPKAVLWNDYVCDWLCCLWDQFFS